MTGRRYITLALVLFALSGYGRETASIARPKLIVGIVIDQMRWDYLYRYYNRYSDRGFKRLMNQGFNCQNTMINYLPSFTAPGHACVYTGSVPAIHGIVANEWVDNKRWEEVYCTEDNTVNSIGSSSRAGKMSPRNLLTTTITDELRLATNMHSRVFSIAIKDRGAILPAGHTANGAYWFDDSTGNFISSSYYGNSLPDWLQKFNGRRWSDALMQRQWELLYDAETYTQSLADDNKYEGVTNGERRPVFPHAAKVPGRGYAGLRFVPAGNTMVMKAAKACIKGEALGKSSATDFLCISLSSPDYVGHVYTPNSMEAEDMFLRLDLELGDFLSYLDKQVGEGNYTVLLTADHGGAHNAKHMQDLKIPAGNIDDYKVLKELNSYVKANSYNTEVKYLMNYQVYWKKDTTQTYDHAGINIKRMILEWLNRRSDVAYAINMDDDIYSASVPEPVMTMVRNGYNKERSGSIQIILSPGWYGSTHATGTTHGSWNPYDTHIPLLWYGWGIPKGETHREVYMTDIAATLAALLHIQMPNGCVGKVITEIVD